MIVSSCLLSGPISAWSMPGSTSCSRYQSRIMSAVMLCAQLAGGVPGQRLLEGDVEVVVPRLPLVVRGQGPQHVAVAAPVHDPFHDHVVPVVEGVPGVGVDQADVHPARKVVLPQQDPADLVLLDPRRTAAETFTQHPRGGGLAGAGVPAQYDEREDGSRSLSCPALSDPVEADAFVDGGDRVRLRRQQHEIDAVGERMLDQRGGDGRGEAAATHGRQRADADDLGGDPTGWCAPLATMPSSVNAPALTVTPLSARSRTRRDHIVRHLSSLGVTLGRSGRADRRTRLAEREPATARACRSSASSAGRISQRASALAGRKSSRSSTSSGCSTTVSPPRPPPAQRRAGLDDPLEAQRDAQLGAPGARTSSISAGSMVFPEPGTGRA